MISTCRSIQGCYKAIIIIDECVKCIILLSEYVIEIIDIKYTLLYLFSVAVLSPKNGRSRSAFWVV